MGGRQIVGSALRFFGGGDRLSVTAKNANAASARESMVTSLVALERAWSAEFARWTGDRGAPLVETIRNTSSATEGVVFKI